MVYGIFDVDVGQRLERVPNNEDSAEVLSIRCEPTEAFVHGVVLAIIGRPGVDVSQPAGVVDQQRVSRAPQVL